MRAAQEWAAAVLAAPVDFDQSTEEGRLRVALLDAVHTLEYHTTGVLSIDVSLIYQGSFTFDMEPGPSGA